MWHKMSTKVDVFISTEQTWVINPGTFKHIGVKEHQGSYSRAGRIFTTDGIGCLVTFLAFGVVEASGLLLHFKVLHDHPKSGYEAG